MAPAPGCPASRVGVGAALLGTGCVSACPAISDRVGGPWPRRKVGAAGVNFAQGLGVVFSLLHWFTASRQRTVKDLPDVRGDSSLRMVECVGEGRRLSEVEGLWSKLLVASV